MKELQEETETRESKTLALLDVTYKKRRQWVVGEMPMIYEILGKFPAFIKPKCLSPKAGLVTNINTIIVHGMIPIATLQLRSFLEVKKNFNKLTSSTNTPEEQLKFLINAETKLTDPASNLFARVIGVQLVS